MVVHAQTEQATPRIRKFLDRYRTVGSILPIYLLVLALLVLGDVLHAGFVSVGNVAQILQLATFTAVAAFGQGIVILTGGFDLSIPWVITMAGLVMTAVAQGSNTAGFVGIALAIGLGALAGFVNGLGVVIGGIHPIVMTLAVNDIIEGIVMTLIQGTPSGSSPPFLVTLTTGTLVAGIPNLVVFLILFVAIGVFVLNFTTFGRRVYAVGNSALAAKLSGVNSGSILVAVYVISGICAAVAGILLAGYTTTAYIDTGDNYLLPSLAAVVVGGASIFGGRGNYAATVGGAIFLTVLAAILSSINWPDAVRTIIQGLAILATVVLVRQR